MNRKIGIDYGRKRTGIAVSDPLGVFASPLGTVPGSGVLDFLREYAESETITDFVVGWPKNLDDTPAEAASDVESFLAELEKAFPGIPVHLEDERFTSVLAHRGNEGIGPEGQGFSRQDKRCNYPPGVSRPPCRTFRKRHGICARHGCRS